MNFPRLPRFGWLSAWIFLLSLATEVHLVAAQPRFVELTADLELTAWRYHEETGLPLRRAQKQTVHCIVGTNAWQMEFYTRTNLDETVWFLGGKLIRVLGSGREAAGEEISYRPRNRGYRSMTILTSADGYPGGEMPLNLPWFAFCSGSYLKQPRRTVPLPAPSQPYAALGFRDESQFFADDFGLPRQVRYYTEERQLKAEYQVTQSTNLMGWNLPSAFTLVQHEPNSLGIWQRQLTVSARVHSIRPCARPELPDEVQARVELWEQSAARKK